jgi:hypothetical protein
MTNSQINFLLEQYLRDYHLSRVEVEEVTRALKNADSATALTIMMLMLKRPVKEYV